jgi:glycosyltransferase involved in cell wall biosynthesis/SAM-dependent methyltransferase
MTGMVPRVSVVISFLNAARFLREAIESVLGQSYRDWELLLVDDGSTDGSTAIAAEYAGTHADRIRYVEHPGHANRGVCASRNLAVRLARGQYIALLDADDVWLPHKLERQVAILESQRSAEMVCGSSEYWFGWTGKDEDLARDHVPAVGVEMNTLFQPLALLALLYPLGDGTAPCPSDLLMRKELVQRVGGFEEAFHGIYQLYEDQAFLCKVYRTAPVFVADECWTRYRIHEASCVSVVTRLGRYHTVRLFFLEWLEAYLSGHQVHEGVLSRLADALADCRRVIAAAEDGRQRMWSLRVEPGNVASTIFPPEDAGRVRVSIDKADTATGHHIQLNQPRLRVQAGGRYVIAFSARADAPRVAGVGIARAGSPWDNLGWYRHIDLTTDWTRFREELTLTAGDDNARIHFDVGGSPISVEVSSVELVAWPDGEPVRPELLAASGHPATLPEHEQRAAKTARPPASRAELVPVSADWGWDRGLPIDRYYLEQFLSARAQDVRGRVLEIGDDRYTSKLGGGRVTSTDILDRHSGNPRATVVADLTNAPHLPAGAFDCVILPQTLQYIYDVRAAIATVSRVLAPGGVVLATVPGITPIRHDDPSGVWYWSFTTSSARRMFEEAFPPANVTVSARGNVLAAVSFLRGIASEELSSEELGYADPRFEVLITVRAVKA